MSAPSIIIIIPARYASSRFPGKPLVDIAGMTMIERVYRRARLSTMAQRVIVATDDERIEGKVTSFGGEAVMTDPNIPSGSERVAAVASMVTADIYINVQGDEPLMPPATIDRAVEPLIADPSIDIGTAACRITDAAEIDNPNVVKVVLTSTNRALYFSRSPVPYVRDPAARPDAFRKHIGIYAFRREALLRFASLPPSPAEQAEQLEQLRALEAGMRIHVAEVDEQSVAVDRPEDVVRVLAILRGETGAPK